MSTLAAILHSPHYSLLPSIISYFSIQGKALAGALSQSFRPTQPVRLKFKVESSKERKIQPKTQVPKPNPGRPPRFLCGREKGEEVTSDRPEANTQRHHFQAIGSLC
jgi:hypothetical protein